MRIFLITSLFPPEHSAGTEKRTLGYASGLRKLGHEVQVLCVGDWEKGHDYWNGQIDDSYQQVPVRRMNLNWVLAPDPNRFLYCNPIVEKNVRRWLEEWKPNIVHVTSCLTLSASVIQAARDMHIPVVLTLTDFWFICPRINLLRRDGSLCDGRTSSWDCIKCMLWDAKAYRWPSLLLPESAVAAVLKWVTKHPTISRIHGLRGMAINMKDRKSYLSRMITAPDCLIAPSKYLRDIFRACGVSAPIQVIYSGHDLSWLETLPEKKSSDGVRVGYVGQITPAKGVDVLLSAFVLCNLEGCSRLLIFGDDHRWPAYTEQLKNFAANANRAIEFRGQFRPECIGQILAEIDVLVVPSLWHENSPRVIQEAFAAKVPVIASDVGGISEFVQHEVNGLLFKRGDADELAGHLRRIVSEPGLIDRLRIGIPQVKRIEQEIRELVGLYHELDESIGTTSVLMNNIDFP